MSRVGLDAPPGDCKAAAGRERRPAQRWPNAGETRSKPASLLDWLIDVCLVSTRGEESCAIDSCFVLVYRYFILFYFVLPQP